MQHLRRAIHRYLRSLHQGRVRESSMREMQPLQRLLPVRIPADGSVKRAAHLILAGFALLAGCTLIMATENKILVHGHRGGRAMRPENTLPAFEYAIGIGVDVLELDMAVTKDNVIVVSHDPYLHPPVCSGAVENATIHELTLAEVKQWDCGKVQNPGFAKQTPVPGTRMPTLDEVFTLGEKSRVEFNIETKSFPDHPELTPSPDEFVKLVLDVVRKHKLEKRVMLQSFDFRTLHAMKKIAPEIRRVALWEGADRDFVSIAKEADAPIVSPAYRLVTPEKVAAAHAAGLQVVPWTANRPADWDKLVAAKVDAIISDDPAELIAYLKGKGLR
jgi:glycerophosphoryl diester phosphodiesterase